MPEAPVVAAPPAERETEAAAATARPGAWARYRPILGSRLLTLASWALFLGGAPASMMAALGLAGALAGGSVIAWGAVLGVLRRETNVDELVMMAIAAALIVGEYWSAGLSVFMMLSGKVLERVTAARAEHAIEGLGQLVPAVARVKDAADSSQERRVLVEQVRPSDVLVVRPGERLPVDGRVVAGRAAVEETAITGESLPVEKAAGDDLYAGTLATAGALEV